jgi:hypothetical protein
MNSCVCHTLRPDKAASNRLSLSAQLHILLQYSLPSPFYKGSGQWGTVCSLFESWQPRVRQI